MVEREGLAAALAFVADEREQNVAAEMLVNDRIAAFSKAPTLVDLEQYAEHPNRKKGTYRFQRADSFAAYIKVHADTEFIFAGDDNFVCWLDGHSAEHPGWQQHIASFALNPTPEWQAWVSQDRNWLDQAAFAEFLEDRIGEVAEPAGATLMEVATTLRVRSSINFQSKVQLTNGAVRMTYEEDIDGRAGETGDVVIPDKLVLFLQPFEGAKSERIDARLRWRLERGKVRFRFALGDSVRQITESAMEQARVEIEKLTGLTVLHGGKA